MKAQYGCFFRDCQENQVKWWLIIGLRLQYDSCYGALVDTMIDSLSLFLHDCGC